VEDALDMAATHEVELFFHCAEHCRVEETAGGYRLERDGIVLELTLPPDGTSEVVTGWVSRSFDRRSPTATIVWRAKLGSRAVLRTTIRILP